MATLFVTAQADEDFAKIIDYLDEQASPTTAIEYSQQLKQLYARLVEFPELGSPRMSLGPGIRSALFSPYIIFYRFVLLKDRVDILRILHGHRDIERSLFKLPRSST